MPRYAPTKLGRWWQTIENTDEKIGKVPAIRPQSAFQSLGIYKSQKNKGVFNSLIISTQASTLYFSPTHFPPNSPREGLSHHIEKPFWQREKAVIVLRKRPSRPIRTAWKAKTKVLFEKKEGNNAIGKAILEGNN